MEERASAEDKGIPKENAYTMDAEVDESFPVGIHVGLHTGARTCAEEGRVVRQKALPMGV